MAKNVNDAFSEFNKNTVNLNPDRTKKANNSRDWLLEQLRGIPDKVDDFPTLYGGMSIKYGSFARKTKIRPLDDIDLILTFSAVGSKYLTHVHGKHYTLHAPETATKLRKLCNDDSTINSRKLINKVVSSLKEIEQYKSAEIHRRSEAATLRLNSYEWNFDIVPAFYTDTGYYLIPDGKGEWKATDPRIDQSRVIKINNKKVANKLLNFLLTFKFMAKLLIAIRNRQGYTSSLACFAFWGPPLPSSVCLNDGTPKFNRRARSQHKSTGQW